MRPSRQASNKFTLPHQEPITPGRIHSTSANIYDYGNLAVTTRPQYNCRWHVWLVSVCGLELSAKISLTHPHPPKNNITETNKTLIL